MRYDVFIVSVVTDNGKRLHKKAAYRVPISRFFVPFEQ
jgi:hypothetical protein